MPIGVLSSYCYEYEEMGFMFLCIPRLLCPKIY